MILSKSIILSEIQKGNIIASGVEEAQIKDQSIDVSLGRYLYVHSERGNLIKIVDLEESPYYEAMPGMFIIAHTDEFVGTTAGSNIIPSFKLKSSAGRLGIIHTLAGHGEVGFFNRCSMEFIVAKPVVLKHKALIGQIYFQSVLGDKEDYSKQGTYQKTNNLEELIRDWTPDSLLPPKELKIK